MRIIGKLALAGVSMLSVSSTAFAQDSGEEGATEGSDIIVTARRKEENLQDVPLVVQAVGGQELGNLQIKEFEDIASVVPGLSLSSPATGLGGIASMRGLDFTSNASGSATSVEFYRNDAPANPGSLLQALYDIGQIEVLRGPQGTLRGRASPSGSITVNTRKPDMNEFGGFITGSYSEDDRASGSGAINAPLIRDILAVRLAGFLGTSRGTGVYGLNLKTGQVDRNVFDETEAVRVSVRADPLDGMLLLDFNYESISNRGRQYRSSEFLQAESFNRVNPAAPASPVLIGPSDDLMVGATPNTLESHYNIFNWQAQLNLFGQTLTYVGADQNNATTGYAPDDLAGLFASGVLGTAPFGQDTIVNGNVEGGHRTRSHEIRLQNEERIAGIFDYVVGGLHFRQQSPTALLRVAASSVNPNTGELASIARIGTLRFRKAKEDSLFANLTAHIGDRFEISGGIRRIKSGQDSGVATAATATLDPLAYADSVANHRCYGYGGGVDYSFPSTYNFANCLPIRKATIYSASAKYNVTDNLMVYANYGTSWRPGNSIIGYRGAAVGTFLTQFLELANEKSKSIEGGIKSSWLDNRLRFNLSVYRQTFKNYPYRLGTPIISTSTPTTAAIAPGFQFVVPTDPKITGFEAELGWEPSERFNLGANLAYAKGKISNATVPCVDLNNDNVQDQATPSAAALLAHVGTNQVDTCQTDLTASIAPKWQGAIQAEYNHPLNSSIQAFGRGLLTWKGNSIGELNNPFDQSKSYSLLNLFAGVRDPDGAWDFTLFAKNLFDVRRVTARTGVAQSTIVAGAANGSTQYVGINVTAPREIGISARFSIGSR